MATLRRIQGAFESAVGRIVRGNDETLKSINDLNSTVKTSSLVNQFYLTPGDVSTITDWTEPTQNGGSVSFTDGEYLVETADQSSSRAVFESADIGITRSGSISIPGLYFRTENEDVPSGTEARWGFFGEKPTGGLKDNGIYIELNTDGLEAVVRRETSETRFRRYEGDWDTEEWQDVPSGEYLGLDPLDGSGPSGVELDLEAGGIWKMPFSYYGGGVIHFVYVDRTEEGLQRWAPFLAFNPKGKTNIGQPNQPVSIHLNSNSSFKVYGAGRQYSTTGDSKVNRTGETHLAPQVSAGTSGWTVLGAMRQKPGEYGYRTALASLGIKTDQPMVLQARVDPTFITSPTPKNPSDARGENTRIDVADNFAGDALGNTIDSTQDEDGNLVFTGAKVGESVSGSSGGGNESFSGSTGGDFDDIIRREDWVIVAGKSLGSQAASVRPLLRMIRNV